MNFNEVYEIAVPKGKREEEKYNKWVSFVVRPLSVLLTLPLLKKDIKPITITKISIVFSLIGFIFLSTSNSMVFKILGWFSFFLWSILDGVDGNLARCSNQCSHLGDLWDTTGGYLAMIFIYFSAGIVSFFDLNSVTLFSNYFYLIFGGLTAIMSIFPRLILHKKKSSSNNNLIVNELTDTSNFNSVKSFVGNITSPSGIMQVFYLFSIITHNVNIFLLIYCIINFGIMCITLRGLLKE